MTRTLLALMIDAACDSADPRQPFMVVDGTSVSFGEAVRRMGRLYTLFADKGLRPGDRVGVVTRSASDMALLLIAGLRAGLVMLNLNPEQSGPERRHAVTAARLAHLFADRAVIDAAALPPATGLTRIEADDDQPTGLLRRLTRKAATTGLRAEIEAAAPGRPEGAAAETDVGLMLLTSGTTSRPKIVQLSHRNIAAQIAAFRQVYDYDRQSRILNPLPLHFTDGIFHGPLIAFLAGATLYRPAVFDFGRLDALLDGIYRDRITHFIVVPALLSMIDRLHDAVTDAFRTPDFRYIRSSGDRLPLALWRSVEERFAVRVVNTYGLSETVCEATYCGPAPDTVRHGTIGKPVGCELRIADENGEALPVGETGELLIRGDIIMAGYFDQPELTGDAVVDGWFRTGDFARIDADGFVTIVGRKKTLIISGGANIQPQDVADALVSHPDIVEAHAFGVPHPVFGEVVAAAVVPRDLDAPPGEDALIAYCRTLLAPNKVPRSIASRAALPRNAAGKVLDDGLRAELDAQPTGQAVQAGDVEAEVIAVAARIFGVDPASLRLSAEPRTTLGWDSFAHVNLMLAIETHFGVTLSARDILAVGRLEHLVERVAKARRAAGERPPAAP